MTRGGVRHRAKSGYHPRRHPWIALPDSIERDDAGGVWASVQPLYEAGRYAEAADCGRELLEANPHPAVFYNVACCESLAGRTADALDHLRRGIELSERCRALAKDDSDFDPIRGEPAFIELMEQGPERISPPSKVGCLRLPER